MRIAVAGTDCVGLSTAVLLAQHNNVFVLDDISERASIINAHISPIRDRDIEHMLCSGGLSLIATTDIEKAFSCADFIVITTPVKFDTGLNCIAASSMEEVIKKAREIAPAAVIVIRAAVPAGYTQAACESLGVRLLFSPELLREGSALYEGLHPSRIIVGCPEGDAEMQRKAGVFAGLLKEGVEDKNVPTLFTGLSEAEAIGFNNKK